MHAAETSVEDRSIFFYDRKGKVARELEQAGYVVRSRTRNRKGQLAHAEYIIYVHPMPTSRSAPKPEWKEHILESQTQEKPAQEDPMQLKKQESNTNPEKAKPIASIHPILPEKRELDRWRARVEYQIEYHVLPDDPRVAVQFDEIVALMAETLCSGKETISMGGEEQPAETGKAQLKRLTSKHIEYALLCMRRTTGPICNIRRYLLTALYSAPVTLESFTEVNRQLRRRAGKPLTVTGTDLSVACQDT